MKKAFTMMCLAAFIAGMGMNSQAQFRQSIFLNGNLPVGAFAGDVNPSRYALGNLTNPAVNVPLGYQEIAKNAKMGVGLGYRASYRFDVGVGQVAPFAQADIYWNTIGGDLNDEYGQVRGAAPTYFNLPIQVGVSYLYDELPNDIIPYGELALGPDMFFITSEGNCQYRDLAGDVQQTMKYSYKPSTAFSLSIGAGAYFGRHVSAGIYYYFMGNHPLDYAKNTANALQNQLAPVTDWPGTVATYSEYDFYQDNPEKRSLSSIALRIGFHF
jgi:hypothetical protein